MIELDPPAALVEASSSMTAAGPGRSARKAPIQVLSPVAGTAPTTLSRGKVVEHDLTMPADYTLAFDIQPTGTERDWASIVHYTNGGNDSRMPGIWFWPGTTKLHVVVGPRNHDINPDYSLPLNQWSSVRVQVAGATAKITVNGRDFDYTGLPARPASTGVTLYAADPWYPAARASIRAAAGPLFSKGSFGTTTLRRADFNARVHDALAAADQEGKIAVIRRECARCGAQHRDVYYKRLTGKTTFDAYGLLLETWSSTNNALNKDFALYSSLADAANDRNAWKFCNYNDRGVAFPRDCGPSWGVGGQWNSLTRGGQADVRFTLEAAHRPAGQPSADDAYVRGGRESDLLALIDDFKLSSIHNLIKAVQDGDHHQARRAACKVLSPAENVLSRFISELAIATNAAVEVGFSTSVTALLFNADWGLSLIWGEAGQFACAENTGFGADLELLGVSIGVGVSISPARFMGGWSTVGAEMNNPDVCVSLSWDFGGVGVAGTMQINPDRSVFGSDGLDSDSGRRRIAESAKASVSDATNGGTGMTLETLPRAIFDGLQATAGAYGVTSVGIEVGVDVGVLDKVLEVVTAGVLIALPGITVTACAQELLYCEGTGCDNKVMLEPWNDGTLCGLGTTCTRCNNKAKYWYSKALTACGNEPKWGDGTICAVGTSCNACQNTATFWPGKFITACGNEPKWNDGTLCALGTTCNQCKNTATYWPSKVSTRCGNEPCWGRGTVCGGGTTCNSCCNGSEGPWYWFGIQKCK